MDVSQQSGPQVEAPSTLPELKITPIFSLSLSYDIYRVSVGEASFIAKVFPPNKLQEYEREKVILTQLDHKHIIKPIDFGHALVSKLASSVINAFILFPECVGGDLLNYVRANGSLSERVAKFYVQQIIEGLSYAHGSLILHPRLLAENVLLDEQRNALLCGWSNSIGHPAHTLKDLLFSVGELIINLVTSRMPFISKDSKSDPFAKFLSEKYIHKLWEQIQKVVKRINKDFQFSAELKALLEGLLLGRIDSFKGVLESAWLKEQVTAGEVEAQLKAQESKALQSKETKKTKALLIQKEQKQMIKSNFSLGLHRKPSRTLDIFQEEYENYKHSSGNNDNLIDEKSKSDTRNYFRIFDSDIRFIVSHLRTRLRQVQRDEQILIDPLLLLKESEVLISGSSLKVNFTFGWNYDELEQKSALCSLNHSIEVALRREGSQVLGRLEVNEGLELNSLYVHQLNEWVMDALQHYG